MKGDQQNYQMDVINSRQMQSYVLNCSSIRRSLFRFSLLKDIQVVYELLRTQEKMELLLITVVTVKSSICAVDYALNIQYGNAKETV